MVTSPSAWLRRQNSPRRARATIIGSLLFWTMFNIHSLIGYDTGPFGCIATAHPVYGLFYSIYSIITSILSLVVMIVFSVLTLLNVRSSPARQIHPHLFQKNPIRSYDMQRTTYIISQVPNHHQERQRQFIRLALLQVAFFIVLNLTWSAFPFYALRIVQQKAINVDQILILGFWSGIGLNLLSTYAAVAFIIYTIASKTFRREFILTIKRMWNSVGQYL
ncbi:unnamed protein product [Rotaria sp. Silwood1]|nr:unnamed protein product [Rotaria sp. Silwood1]CAF3405236.1 unnamed protein product [Rotaria sp. Silwood1]CAF3418295.1 unnamed protein product [Rotaria sp. Silwood1]CAF3427427.1 unnamed protein product [Rotaria sp. Silwood1]CAF4747563.1 unnamed protein product [Rotaria sp. Silwood1]